MTSDAVPSRSRPRASVPHERSHWPCLDSVAELVVGRLYWVRARSRPGQFGGVTCGFEGRYLGPYRDDTDPRGEDAPVLHYLFDTGGDQRGWAGVVLNEDWECMDIEPRYVVTMACGHQRVHASLGWDLQNKADATDYCAACSRAAALALPGAKSVHVLVTAMQRIPGAPP